VPADLTLLVFATRAQQLRVQLREIPSAFGIGTQ